MNMEKAVKTCTKPNFVSSVWEWLREDLFFLYIL